MKERRKDMAKETVRILELGHYTAGNTTVSIAEAFRKMVDNTKLYTSEDLDHLVGKMRDQPKYDLPGEIQVTNETTLDAAARFVSTGDYRRIGVLNFASAKNPGGGFLGGAQAQEESLARSSALYESLIRCQNEYYDFHRQQSSLLYSDRMIYTPECPVFRNDGGQLLEKSYFVDFVTSPAPNLGAMPEGKSSRDQVAWVLKQRSEKLLALFSEKQCDAVVLGAWGCGVFRNDPKTVAATFAEHLENGWSRHFRVIEFAVLDKTPRQENITVFKKHLELE